MKAKGLYSFLSPPTILNSRVICGWLKPKPSKEKGGGKKIMNKLKGKTTKRWCVLVSSMPLVFYKS